MKATRGQTVGYTIDSGEVSDIITQVVTAVQPMIMDTVIAAVTAATSQLLTAWSDSVKSVNLEMEKVKKQMQNQKMEIEKLEQYSRKENIRISRIEEADTEDEELLAEKVCNIANETGMELRKSDISTAHRIGRKVAGRCRPVIVRFVSRMKRTELLRKKKNLQGNDDFRRVFINEDLTTTRYKLFQYSKAKGDAFIRDGKIICKKDNAYVTVSKPEDLLKLGYVDGDIDFNEFGMNI